MPHLEVLQELLVIYLIAGVVVFVFQRGRLPAVLGMLVAGTLMGPHGFRLVHNSEHVELLAEIGVVLLLFTVGLEFNTQRMTGMSKLLLAGALQVAFTILGVVFALHSETVSFGQAIFAGFLVTHASTTILIKLLMERGESSAPHARISLGILIVQDLSVVWMMVLAPILAGKENDPTALLLTLGKAIGIVGGILLASRYVLPWILFQVVRLRNRELFILLITLTCMGTAWLTAQAGLSLALGAFLAGMALANSEYSYQTLSEVIPFRDSFVSLFFVSIGMLFDINFVMSHPGWILSAVIGVTLLKFFTAAVPSLIIGYPLRTSILVGAGLAHLGEFGFVLSKPGRELGLLSEEAYQIFLGTGVITMALSPLLLNLAPRFSYWADRQPWLRRLARSRQEKELSPHGVNLHGHVVILGYGLTGRNLSRVLAEMKIPFVVLEMNPDTVRKGRQQGEPLYYGDCTREAVLEQLGIHHAKLLVIAISDPPSIRRATQLARHLNSDLHIIVRTRYVSEIEELMQLGANQIVPEDFETAVEIFSRVLRNYQVPRNDIMNIIDRVRGDHYGMLRHMTVHPEVTHVYQDLLSQIEVESCKIRPESPAVGKSAMDLALRSVTGCTLIGLRRDDKLQTNPPADLKLQVNDVVFLVGTHKQLNTAVCLFDPRLMENAESFDALSQSSVDSLQGLRLTPQQPSDT
ncbi:MAG: cation:proton antiporter [Planctomycetales bacterium]